MVTGSLQIKGLVYYIVLNVYPNNKRNQKWIPTTVVANGKKVNQIKAEKLLSDIRMIYDKDSYIETDIRDDIWGFAYKCLSEGIGVNIKISPEGEVNIIFKKANNN